MNHQKNKNLKINKLKIKNKKKLKQKNKNKQKKKIDLLQIHGEIINNNYHKIINDVYYGIKLSIIDMFRTKKILKYKKMHKRKLRNFTIAIVLKKGKKNWMNKIFNYDFILCGMFLYISYSIFIYKLFIL